MVVVGILGTRFGGDYNDNFELPDTESTTAQELLADLSGGGAGTGAGLEGQVVWKPDSGTATDASAEATMTDLLTELSTSPGVSCVLTPVRRATRLGMPGATRGPEAKGGQQGEQPQPELLAGGGGRARALRPGRRQPGRHRRLRHGDVRGRVIRRPRAPTTSSPRWTSSRRRTAATACRSGPTACSSSSVVSRRPRRASASPSRW